MKGTCKAVMVVAALAGCLAYAQPANASYAYGYSRPVDIWLLNTFLSHTYEYYSGYGYATFSGGTTGGNANQYTSSIYSNEYNCMVHQGELTYLITGVCHNGTNRGLYHTSVNWVRYWGNPGVDGSGASYTMYCDMGAALWCYGAPC